MIYLYAFLIGGLICAIAEIVQTIFKLTPGHVTGIFVMLGALLDIGGFYDKLIKLAGAGALLPITSFGHSLSHASFEAAKTEGFLGLSGSMFNMTSSGITWAIVLSILISLIFKPKS